MLDGLQSSSSVPAVRTTVYIYLRIYTSVCLLAVALFLLLINFAFAAYSDDQKRPQTAPAHRPLQISGEGGRDEMLIRRRCRASAHASAASASPSYPLFYLAQCFHSASPIMCGPTTLWGRHSADHWNSCLLFWAHCKL